MHYYLVININILSSYLVLTKIKQRKKFYVYKKNTKKFKTPIILPK